MTKNRLELNAPQASGAFISARSVHDIRKRLVRVPVEVAGTLKPIVDNADDGIAFFVRAARRNTGSFGVYDARYCVEVVTAEPAIVRIVSSSKEARIA